MRQHVSTRLLKAIGTVYGIWGPDSKDGSKVCLVDIQYIYKINLFVVDTYLMCSICHILVNVY